MATPLGGLRLELEFERLYRRHRSDVYRAVLRDVRDADEAEDVTQIAFLDAYRALLRGVALREDVRAPLRGLTDEERERLDGLVPGWLE